MKTINLEPRLSLSRTRSDFLTLMPAMRTYILQQSAELPQNEVAHTLSNLEKQCPAIDDDDNKRLAIVGCIDTEKPAFQTFWEYANAAIKSHRALAASAERKEFTPEHRAKGTIAVVGAVIHTYEVGMTIYNAAKDAYSRPVARDHLGAYWDRVKI